MKYYTVVKELVQFSDKLKFLVFLTVSFVSHKIKVCTSLNAEFNTDSGVRFFFPHFYPIIFENDLPLLWVEGEILQNTENTVRGDSQGLTSNI